MCDEYKNPLSIFLVSVGTAGCHEPLERWGTGMRRGTGQPEAKVSAPGCPDGAAERSTHHPLYEHPCGCAPTELEMMRVTLSLAAPPCGLPTSPGCCAPLDTVTSQSWALSVAWRTPSPRFPTCYLPPFYRLERVLNCSHTQPARLTFPKANAPASFLTVMRSCHSGWLMAVYSSQ